ncbi:methyltransferase domain-containing protein [Lysobacter sp. CA199]|uniref:class I SAM-dependent methyltransferase n=1 Tax=Lysobacter sp. CA199 TaxID=3455608 RepID=UPI003F8D3396
MSQSPGGGKSNDLSVDACSETAMYTWERHLGQTISSDEFEASYRGQARSELTGLFSADRQLLLEIGCASGATAALLKQQIPGLQAWGVEPESAAAEIAAQRLDRVFACKLEDVDLHAEGLAYGSVDAVLLADVLEHMYDPWRALVQLKPFLAKNAEVVISIPNVRNLGLMADLADGRFDYHKWGLLDITHIRFFTLDGAIRMLHETGYGVRHVQANVDPPLSAVLAAGVPADKVLKFDRLSLAGVEPRELVELCAVQFFIKASPMRIELVGYGTASEAQTETSGERVEEAVSAAGGIVDISPEPAASQPDSEMTAEVNDPVVLPAEAGQTQASQAIESGFDGDDNAS